MKILAVETATAAKYRTHEFGSEAERMEIQWNAPGIRITVGGVADVQRVDALGVERGALAVKPGYCSGIRAAT